MKQSHTPLRGALLFITLVMFIAAYIFLFQLNLLRPFYGSNFPDTAHLHMAMLLGALCLVFSMGSLMAFLSPVKRSGIVMTLILVHFMVFLVDVIIMARGSVLPLYILVPEMVYCLAVCTVLIRYYPIANKGELSDETAFAVADALKKKFDKQEKEEKKVAKKLADTVKKEAKEEEV